MCLHVPICALWCPHVHSLTAEPSKEKKQTQQLKSQFKLAIASKAERMWDPGGDGPNTEWLDVEKPINKDIYKKHI